VIFMVVVDPSGRVARAQRSARARARGLILPKMRIAYNLMVSSRRPPQRARRSRRVAPRSAWNGCALTSARALLLRRPVAMRPTNGRRGKMTIIRREKRPTKAVNTRIEFRRASWVAAALVALALPFSAPLGGPTEAHAQAPSVAPEAPGVVNINTATVEQLARLPGIGETRAEAILAARQARPFRRVQEIMRGRGIGRATFRKLRPMLAVEGETTLPASRR
jgi:competence protein ComEA